MNGINTLSAITTKKNTLLNQISNTCDALIGALELTTESTSQYGGGMVEKFDAEYVDKVISLLIQLRLYTTRLHKEVLNGLIKSPEEMKMLVEGMYDFSEKLHEAMRENGNLRNNFEYGLREIDTAIEEILADLVVS